MTITAFVLTLVCGLALLLLGRQLFWIYVSLLGFLLGYEATLQYMANGISSGADEAGGMLWLPVLLGLLVGLAAALAAIVYQYIAVGLAGFVGGAYLALAATGLDPVGGGTTVVTLLILAGGGVGALLFLLLFDPALVVLSAMTGAGLLLIPFPLDQATAPWFFLLLSCVGVLFQFTVLGKPAPPGGKSSRGNE